MGDDCDYDTELEDMMDTTWIENIRDMETVYNKYYVSPMRHINVFFLLVCGGNVVGFDSICVNMGTPNVVGWEEMVPSISEYMSRGYVLSKRIKYGVTLTPEEVLCGRNLSQSGSVWEDVGTSSDVHFGDTIGFMHDMSCIVCIMNRFISNKRSKKNCSGTRKNGKNML